jgi:hypothetical protein
MKPKQKWTSSSQGEFTTKILDDACSITFDEGDGLHHERQDMETLEESKETNSLRAKFIGF